MQTFASMDIPDKPGAPEACPLCAEVLPLPQFAPHVYQCIKSLDAVEREHQEQIDRKLAERYAQGAEFRSFHKSDNCEKGAQCDRTDAQHFVNLRHPLVPCPICNGEFEVFSVNAHITMCLESGGGGFGPSSSSFISSSGRPQQQEKQPMHSFGGPRKQASEDEEESMDDESLHSMGLNARSSSGGNLSRQQMKAMATMVVEQKSKGPREQDMSLLQLLDTFKTLGFTKESLSSELKRQASENSSMDAIAAAEDGPSPMLAAAACSTQPAAAQPAAQPTAAAAAELPPLPDDDDL